MMFQPAMKQTPINDAANADVLSLMPRDCRRIVEVGCSGGGLAREYKKLNSACEYIGIELEPEYAALATRHCDRVVVGSIEHMADDVFASLFPSDCWVFADVLEHLYDPWQVLRRIHGFLPTDGSIVACIPNAQHWTLQVRLNAGDFRYQESGLLDRTHIRWFTKATMLDLFRDAGFDVVEGGARILVGDEEYCERAMVGIRALAEATGTDVAAALENAAAFQWIVRAVPASP